MTDKPGDNGHSLLRPFKERKPPKRRSTDGLEHLMASNTIRASPERRHEANSPFHNPFHLISNTFTPRRTQRPRGDSRTYRPTALSVSMTAEPPTPPPEQPTPPGSPRPEAVVLPEEERFSEPAPIDWTKFDRSDPITESTPAVFTATIPYHGGEIRINTTCSPYYPDSWYVTVRSGAHPSWVHVPRFYAERYTSSEIDFDKKLITVNWTVDGKNALARAHEYKPEQYRVNFSEDSEFDSDLSDDGWHMKSKKGKKTVRGGEMFLESGYDETNVGKKKGANSDPANETPIEDILASRDRPRTESIGNLTKAEKKAIKKSLKMTSTKQLGVEVREAKKAFEVRAEGKAATEQDLFSCLEALDTACSLAEALRPMENPADSTLDTPYAASPFTNAQPKQGKSKRKNKKKTRFRMRNIKNNEDASDQQPLLAREASVADAASKEMHMLRGPCREGSAPKTVDPLDDATQYSIFDLEHSGFFEEDPEELLLSHGVDVIVDSQEDGKKKKGFNSKIQDLRRSVSGYF